MAGTTTYPTDPPLECDVVMKGGITSGVVYPRAVCELARTYRLRELGGASAGAIAAAAAAAAELGRASGGFERLDALPSELTATGPDGRSRLFGLFQPSLTAAPLYRALTAVLTSTGIARYLALAGGLLRGYWWPAFLGAVPGLACIGAAQGRAPAIAGGALLLVIGLVAGTVWGALRTVAKISGEGFGMCSGMPGVARPGVPALTPWLHGQLQAIAGLDASAPPLTFGDLDAQGITLRMMTTDITQHLPRALPWTSREFYFDPGQMRALFPRDVVDAMEAHPPPLIGGPAREWRTQLVRAQALPLRPWPAPEHLPVLVATRMSLSFPVLVTAVPLHAIDYSDPANEAARDTAIAWHEGHPDAAPSEVAATLPAPRFTVTWFSDGGLCANLPVHFFDTPVPTRPTFAFDLAPFPRGRHKEDDEALNSNLPTENAAGQQRTWHPLRTGSLAAWLGFFTELVGTARGWIDEGQLVMPGYRDRIVTLFHDGSEGGMNLSMDPTVVRSLSERGRAGAAKLVQSFAGDDPGRTPAWGWENHRWVRLRTSAAGLDTWLDQFRDGYAAASPGATPYAELAGDGAEAPLPSYDLTKARRAELNEHTRELLAVADSWAQDDAMTYHAPRPRPRLRQVPDDGTAAGLDRHDGSGGGPA